MQKILDAKMRFAKTRPVFPCAAHANSFTRVPGRNAAVVARVGTVVIEVSRVIAVLCRIAPRVTGRSRRQSSESWSDTNRVVGYRCRRVTDRSHTRSKTPERNVRPRD